MNIDYQETLRRREEALLNQRVRALAREGKPIAAAYVNNPPPLKLRWNHIR